jgi:hypothetical protein
MSYGHRSARFLGAALLTGLVSLPSRCTDAADPCVPEFESQPIFAIAPNFGTNTLADFDGDGHLDLSIGFVFYLGDGAGDFGTAISLPPREPVGFDIKTGDFDGDGLLDAAIVQFVSDRLWMFYGTRDEARGSFFEAAREVSFAGIVTSIWHIDKADFDGDDRLDLVGVSIFEENHVLVRNLGARKFSVSALRSLNGGAHMLAAGDYDGDGHPDIAMGRGSETSLFFGQGDGTFGSEKRGQLVFGGQFGNGHRFRGVDLNGDGRSELIATADRRVLVYDGRDFAPSRGTPAEPAAALLTSGGARFIEAVDMNVDGVLDVVAVAEAGAASTWNMFLGKQTDDGSLAFSKGTSSSTALSGHGSVLAVGDVNEDGAPDIVVTTEDTNQARVILSLDVCGRPPVPRGDVNADDVLDISDPISVLRFLFLGARLECRAAGEVNGDGKIDLSDPVYLLARLFLGGPAEVGGDVSDCNA